MRLSPTQQLLICCALNFSEPQPKSAIEDLLDFPIDWSNFLRKAAYLGIIPSCHCNLELFYDKIPSFVSKKLSEAFLFNSVRNRALWNCFQTVYEAFKKAGIDLLPLKGPVLGYILYSRFNKRRSSDLDILVKKSQIDQCRKVLEELGYFPEGQPYSEDFIKKYLRHRPFGQKNKTMILCSMIEIHWNLYSQGSQEFDMEVLWDTAIPLKVENRTLLCPSYTFTLIYLAIGLRIHGYQRFWYLSDIHVLLTKYKDKIDWAYAVKQVILNKQKTALFYALFLSQELFKTSIPPQVLKQLKPGWIRHKAVSFLINPERILSLQIDYSSVFLSDMINLLTVDTFIDILRSIYDILFVRTDDILGRYLKKDKKAKFILPSYMQPFYLLWILIRKSVQQIKTLFSSGSSH